MIPWTASSPIYANAWQFLNASDHATADEKKAAFQDRLQRLETRGSTLEALEMQNLVFHQSIGQLPIVSPSYCDLDFIMVANKAIQQGWHCSGVKQRDLHHSPQS
ncbi:hypothetical protein [Rhizobium lentis]|uniref:Uncharacterized protein n=1 Tax=Rhizobium lentis TaxID=1138194 RepID=A0A7W8XHX8_9HYPH|nr:hypothetical protein [Rhizobium lentis]MBB5563136.1 hypothetical protein [Rhizobium lentis]